jgi:hypothetical protein
LISAGTLTRQFLFDEDEVVANQIENFLDRQKRDGTFSWAGLAARVQLYVGQAGLRNLRPGDSKESPEIGRSSSGEFVWR